MRKICLFIVIVIVAVACGSKKENVENMSFDLKEKKLPCTITFSRLAEDTVQVLTNELVNQLLRDFKKHEGNKMKIQTSIPENWGVEYKLTPMSSDFDIWVISNIDEPTYKFLATVNTSTETQPSIIQAIPIAYNMGIEKSNFIESEQWIANIHDDYTITVTKIYEKLHSLSDTSNTKNESMRIKNEDIYIIENDGKITYKIPTSFNIDYRLIVQFADTASVGNVLDENWLWNSIEIQQIIEPMDILFTPATTRFDKLSIYNYRGDEVDIIDISSYLNKHSIGYLAIKKGEKPMFIPYSSYKECLRKAFKYFGIENTLEIEENDEELNQNAN